MIFPTIRLTALFFLLFVAHARPADGADFDDLHQQYLSLRNTDLEFARLTEWRRLERDLVEFARFERNPLQAQRALLECAILYQTLSGKIEPARNRLRAMAILDELVGRFPQGALADDALLTESQILAEEGKTREAQATLRFITTQYPDSDMALVASDRLKVGLAKKSNPAASSSTGEALPIIVLDPGHGGEDFGAVGVGGLLEKDVALDVALKAKKLIEDKKKYTVFLTRGKDQFVPLVDRMAFANQKGARLFVSIHANASVKKNMSGIEVYYLDNKSDKASAKLAERENRAAAAGGGESDLSFMLSDLIQNAKLPESIELAKMLQGTIVAAVRAAAPKTANLGVKSGPFYVLVGAHMPCVLVEIAFIDHSVEGRRLGEQSYRTLLAQGIANGIDIVK